MAYQYTTFHIQYNHVELYSYVLYIFICYIFMFVFYTYIYIYICIYRVRGEADPWCFRWSLKRGRFLSLPASPVRLAGLVLSCLPGKMLDKLLVVAVLLVISCPQFFVLQTLGNPGNDSMNVKIHMTVRAMYIAVTVPYCIYLDMDIYLQVSHQITACHITSHKLQVPFVLIS